MNIIGRRSSLARAHLRLSLYSQFRKLFSDQSCGTVLIPPYTSPHPTTSPQSFSKTDFSIVSDLLRDPKVTSGPSLVSGLNRSGIEPDPALLLALFQHFDHSPKLLHTLFLWADRKPKFKSSETLFNCMIKALAKAKEFDCAWSLVLDKIRGREAADFVFRETFVILIRHYARARMAGAAIRTFEFASNLDLVKNFDSGTGLLEVLLDSLCKQGHVKVASEYFDKRKELDGSWVPSVRVHNILLNGWFKSGNVKGADRFWFEMRKENVRPDVVTYGTLVEGYCRIRHVERAIQLVKEMRMEGIEPNAIVYNAVIDCLAEAGRFEDVSRMMERFLVCEPGPSIATYNSLVKAYCKVGNLNGASKILKMMISRGFLPTPTTYNYFFRHFSKFRKVEEAMNLYTKMTESGYTHDRLTYHLLLKLLCEEERLDLAIQVSKEMKSRGCDMDLDTSTMLIHLLCRIFKFDEAFAEFEDMIRRGIVPHYLTFQRLNDEFKKRGLSDMAQKLSNLMSNVPHSMKFRDSCSGDQNDSHTRRRTILQRAKTMSKILETCENPRELIKNKSSLETAVSGANRLIQDTNKRAKGT